MTDQYSDKKIDLSVYFGFGLEAYCTVALVFNIIVLKFEAFVEL